MDWTLVAALAGIAISLLALYFSQIRGAHMTAEIIQPPKNWTLGLQQQWGYGAPTLASVHNATHCIASATTYSLVANDGPKGGAVWNLILALDPLAVGLVLNQPFLASEPITLGGNSSGSLSVTYTVAWSIKHSQAILANISKGGEDVLDACIVCPGHLSTPRHMGRSSAIVGQGARTQGQHPDASG